MCDSRADIFGASSVTSPAWLTETLRCAHAIRHVTVVSVESSVLTGIGQNSLIMRLRLGYDTHEKNAPNSLVAKMPTPDPERRAGLRRFYTNEVRFYRELAGNIPLRTPLCYYIKEDDSFILLLEDLGCIPTNTLEPLLRSADIKSVLTELGRFHAAYWNRLQDGDMVWLPRWSIPVQDERDRVAVSVDQGWSTFTEVVKKWVPRVADLDAEGIVRGFLASDDFLYKEPFTVIHGDFRPSNLAWLKQGEARFAVFDWQFVQYAPAVIDIAHLMVDPQVSLDVVEEQAILLKCYYESLLTSGIDGYSWEQFIHAYHLAIFREFRGFLSISHAMDFSHPVNRYMLEKEIALIAACQETVG